MAVPTYESGSRGGVATGSVGPQATPDAFGIDPSAGRALQQGIESAVGFIQAKKKQDEEVWLNNTITQAQKYWMDEMERRQNSAPLGADGFTPKLAEDFDKFQSDQVNAAPSVTARNALMESMNRLGTNLHSTALTFEAGQKVAKRVSDMTVSNNRAEAMVMRNPELLDSMIGQQLGTVRSLGDGAMPASSIEKLKVGATKGLFEAALEGYGVADKPEVALKMLEDPKYDSLLSGDQRASMIRHFQSMENVKLNKNRESIMELHKSNLKQIRDTGKPNPNADLATIGKLIPRAGQDVQLAVKFHDATDRIANAAPDAIGQVLEDFKPKAVMNVEPTDPAALSYNEEDDLFKEVQMLVKGEMELRTNNPAGAADRTDAAKNILTKMDAEQDPMKRKVLRQELFKVRRAYQTSVGIASFDQRIISTGEAKNISEVLQKAEPGQVQATMMQLADDYGTNVKDLQYEMSQLKGADRLPGKYGLLFAKANTMEGHRLAVALKQPSEVLDKATPLDKDKTKIRTAIENTPEMVMLQEALTSAGGERAKAFNELGDAVFQYAQQLIIEKQASGTDAGRKAVEHLIATTFEFSESPNGTKFFIPKEETNGRPFGEDSLNRIKYRLRNDFDDFIKREEFAVDAYGGAYPGLKPEDYKPRVIDAIQNRSVFVNTGDGSGVKLYADFTGNGNFLEILDKKGQPFYKSFSTLAHEQRFEAPKKSSWNPFD